MTQKNNVIPENIFEEQRRKKCRDKIEEITDMVVEDCVRKGIKPTREILFKELNERGLIKDMIDLNIKFDKQ